VKSRLNRDDRFAEIEKENQALLDRNKTLADQVVAGLDESASFSPTGSIREASFLIYALQL
jgi:hypothetical protein